MAVTAANRNQTHYDFKTSSVGRRIRRAGLWMMTGLAIAWLAGCGGAPESSQSPPQQPTTATPPPAQPAVQPQPAEQPAAQPQPAVQPVVQTQPPAESPSLDQPSAQSPPVSVAGPSPEGSEAGLSSGSPGPPSPESQGPQQPASDQAAKPSRPDDFAKWKKPDYLSAKQEHDPRLIEAIGRLAGQHVGDPSIVDILAAVLQWTEPSPQPGAQPGLGPIGATPAGPAAAGGFSSTTIGAGTAGGLQSPASPATDQQIVTATVGALVLNNTDPARKVLREVVSGELRTDDDATAAPLALKAMLQQSSPENEALLLRILLEPEKLRTGSAASTAGAMGQPAPGMPGYVSTSPGQLMSAMDLRAQALPLVDALATEAFRVKLAEHLLSDKATRKQREELVPLLEKQRTENLAAQLLVYRAAVPSPELKANFEKYFAEMSSVAMGHLLGALADREQASPSPSAEPSGSPGDGWGPSSTGGVGAGSGGTPQPSGPVGVSGGGGSIGVGGLSGPTSPGLLGPEGELGADALKAKLDDPKVIYPVAKKLWDATTAEMVSQRTQEVASLDQESTTLALARTMPVDQVRAALFKLFNANLKNGPGLMLDAGASGGGLSPMGGGLTFGTSAGMSGDGAAPTAFFDPGLLVVIKSLPLPREEKSKRAGASKRGSQPQLSAAGGAVLSGAGAATPEAEPTTPPDQWRKLSENVMVLLCRQCQAAAKSQPEEDPKTADKPPIRLHSTRANVTTRYTLKWPEDAAVKLGDFKLDPVKVHYVRIEEENQFSRLEKFYRRQGRPKQRAFGQGGARFDCLKDSKTPGHKLSTDVIITGAGGAALTPRERGQKEPVQAMVVEILTIEMKDPTGAAAEPEPADDK